VCQGRRPLTPPSSDDYFRVSFCTRAIWLEAGQVKMAGPARDVADAYQLAMTGQSLDTVLVNVTSHQL
jgi:hypothetical protein